jgi:acetyl-CoA carboxylase biotin carboxyl carrier protein
LNHEQIEALVAVLKDSPRLAEIEIRSSATDAKGATLRVRRPVSPATTPPSRAPRSRAGTNGTGVGARPSSGPEPPSVRQKSAPSPDADVTFATSTLVGVFRSGKVGPLPAGASVTEGQVIGYVESLGLLTECVAPTDGVVRALLVQDGEPVEYGQALLEIDPLAAGAGAEGAAAGGAA